MEAELLPKMAPHVACPSLCRNLSLLSRACCRPVDLYLFSLFIQSIFI